MQWSQVRSANRARGVIAVALAAAALALAMVSGSATAGATGPTSDSARAAAAATAWLAGQMDVGIPMQNFGSPDWGVTLDAALGMAAEGSGGAQIDAVWAALIADREAAVAPGGTDSPGRLARTILLARALGEDPAAVGTEPGADLVARLQATRQAAGPDIGLFGSGDATYDGAFRQGYALAALAGVGVTPDPTSVDWLLAQQCGPESAGGAWMPYRTDPSVPCAFDGGLYVGPDTNATSAAITGLAAVSAGSEAIDAALDWLDSAQEPDGGWAQLQGFGTDPNSTALVLQALFAVDAGADPRFADQGTPPLAALLSFQLGCESPEADRGAFTFPGSNGAPNGFATAQALGAAAGAAVLFEAGDVEPTVTPLACDQGNATSTTSTTAILTSGPPAGPTAVPGPAVPVAPGPSVAATPASSTQAEVLGATQVATGGASAAALSLTGAASAMSAGAGLLAVLAGLVLLAVSRRRSAS